MILTGDAVFLNAESKQGYSDPNKTYYNALLMQGTNTVNVSVDRNLFIGELASIKQFTPCFCKFEYNTVYKSLKLLSICPKDGKFNK